MYDKVEPCGNATAAPDELEDHMPLPTYLVPFVPGNGTDIFPDGQVMLTVTYIAQFPRDIDGLCAFCHGDPCAEFSPETSHIWRYMNFPMYPGDTDRPETCPLCNGRPS